MCPQTDRFMPGDTNLSVDDFDAAKAVFELLKDLPRERQERVLRWISEGLGITALPHSATREDVRTPSTIVAPTGTPAIAAAAAQAAGSKDIKSFVDEKDPKSDNQFAAVVAYYYRFEAPPALRRDSIDSAVLQEAARLSRRKRLKEPRYALNNAKSLGYLDSAERGQFSINSVGENLVAMALPGDGSAPAATRRGKNSGTRGPKKRTVASKRKR